LVIVQVLVLSLVLTLFGRLWYLQVMASDQFTQAAAENRTREILTPAVRGIVLDDRGRPLVRNRTEMVISVSRTEMLRQPDRGRALIARVAAVISQPVEDIWARTRVCGAADAPEAPVCWNGKPQQPIPITDDADMAMALQIIEHQEDYPGVTAELAPVREYPLPEGANAAHLLGYVGPVTAEELDRLDGAGGRGAESTEAAIASTDAIGKSGLELQYDADLRGTPGVETLAVDHNGAVEGKVGEVAATPGNYLVTSLDAQIQAVAERELRASIDTARAGKTFQRKKFPADSGAVVVLDHQTGRIVAMASYPSYDPNVWVGGITPENYATITSAELNYPNQSRATQGQFAPASTFKVVTSSAAANAGYNLNSGYPCTSSYNVGNRSFRNYESRPYGTIPLRRALEVSCNTVFYRIGYEMWLRDGGNVPHPDAAEYLAKTARAYGLGRKSGIDLPSEARGLIVDGAFKRERHAATKERWCKWAREGYPDRDPARAAEITQIMAENCADGYKVRAGDAVNAAIGQGETVVTPLQLALVYGSIANGGKVWSPRIGKAIMSPDGRLVRSIDPEVASAAPASPETLSFLREALYGVAKAGTGAGVFRTWPHDQIRIGAKTGSGQVNGKESTSWFATITDRYAIVMMVSQGGTGSGTSGPGVRRIYDAIYGVVQGAVVPGAALLPGGLPPETLPTITPDGMVIQPDGSAVAPPPAPGAVPDVPVSPGVPAPAAAADAPSGGGT
jgi:penicillin-binding protein 2